MQCIKRERERKVERERVKVRNVHDKVNGDEKTGVRANGRKKNAKKT